MGCEQEVVVAVGDGAIDEQVRAGVEKESEAGVHGESDEDNIGRKVEEYEIKGETSFPRERLRSLEVIDRFPGLLCEVCYDEKQIRAKR